MKFQVLKQDIKTGKITDVAGIKFNSREAAEKYLERFIPEGKPAYLYPFFIGEIQEDGSAKT